MSKIYLRDVGSHPERDLEVTLFPDGELQFEADNGKYVHVNIAREGVKELLDFLLEEIRPTPLGGNPEKKDAMKITLGYGNVSVMTYREEGKKIDYGLALCIHPECHEIGEEDLESAGKPLNDVQPDLEIEFLNSASAQVFLEKVTLIRDSLAKVGK